MVQQRERRASPSVFLQGPLGAPGGVFPPLLLSAVQLQLPRFSSGRRTCRGLRRGPGARPCFRVGLPVAPIHSGAAVPAGAGAQPDGGAAGAEDPA